jgi:hypothetical protein
MLLLLLLLRALLLLLLQHTCSLAASATSPSSVIAALTSRINAVGTRTAAAAVNSGEIGLPRPALQQQQQQQQCERIPIVCKNDNAGVKTRPPHHIAPVALFCLAAMFIWRLSRSAPAACALFNHCHFLRVTMLTCPT